MALFDGFGLGALDRMLFPNPYARHERMAGGAGADRAAMYGVSRSAGRRAGAGDLARKLTILKELARQRQFAQYMQQFDALGQAGGENKQSIIDFLKGNRWGGQMSPNGPVAPGGRSVPPMWEVG